MFSVCQLFGVVFCRATEETEGPEVSRAQWAPWGPWGQRYQPDIERKHTAWNKQKASFCFVFLFLQTSDLWSVAASSGSPVSLIVKSVIFWGSTGSHGSSGDERASRQRDPRSEGGPTSSWLTDQRRRDSSSFLFVFPSGRSRPSRCSRSDGRTGRWSDWTQGEILFFYFKSLLFSLCTRFGSVLFFKLNFSSKIKCIIIFH